MNNKKALPETQKSTEVLSEDTGSTEVTDRGNKFIIEGGQREPQSRKLAGLSRHILTPDQEIDAALSDFMDAFYEDNTFNLRKV